MKLRGVDSGRPKVKSLCGLEQWGFCCTVLSPVFYFVQEIECDNYVVVTGIFAQVCASAFFIIIVNELF